MAERLGVDPGGDVMIHGIRNGLGWLGPLHRKFGLDPRVHRCDRSWNWGNLEASPRWYPDRNKGLASADLANCCVLQPTKGSGTGTFTDDCSQTTAIAA